MVSPETYKSDSAPSDDKNDAEYLHYSEIKKAGKSWRPAKRRQRALDKASSTSPVSRQSFSKSPCATRPEPPLEDLSVEFSQTNILSSAAGR